MKISVLLPIPFMLLTGLFGLANPSYGQGFPLVSGLPIKAGTAETRAVQKQFAAYPISDALSIVIQYHLNYALHKKAGIVVLATSFMEGKTNEANYYEQNQKGEVSRYTDMYNWAIQGGGKQLLSWDEHTKVSRLLSAMPANNPPATLKDLLIVTYFDGKRWNTRLYSLNSFPGDLSSIDPEGSNRKRASSALLTVQ